MIACSALQALDPQGEIDLQRAALALSAQLPQMDPREMGQVLAALQALAEKWLANPEPIEPYEVVPLLVLFAEGASRRSQATPGDQALREVLLALGRCHEKLIGQVAASEASFGIPPSHFTRASGGIAATLSRAWQAWVRHDQARAPARQEAATKVAERPPARVERPVPARPPVAAPVTLPAPMPAPAATADSSGTIKCPFHGPLQPATVCAVTVWLCPICHGMWVDKGQLSLMYADPEPYVPHLDRGRPQRINAGPERDLPCLRCRVPMEHTLVFGVNIDMCASHGAWFDAGELLWVLEFLSENNRQARPAKEGQDSGDKPLVTPDDVVGTALGLTLEFALNALLGLLG